VSVKLCSHAWRTALNKLTCVNRNDVNVDGATHKQVVDLIKSGGDQLVLVGMSGKFSSELKKLFNADCLIYCDMIVLPSVIDDFEHLTVAAASSSQTNNHNDQHHEASDNSSSDSSTNDYTDRRSLPITIPSYELVELDKNEKFVVFNIYMAGRHLCSR
jgi:sorting nexin-27